LSVPKGSQFDELARDAAQRIEDARSAGEQLTFLPDEPQPGAVAARMPRGKGKIQSQLRDWAAQKGLRMPEDVLIEMAGMASTEDAFLTAMARTEQLLAWAQAGAATEHAWTNEAGEVKRRILRTEPTMGERLEAFKFVYTAQLRAAEALLPYGLGKVNPDVAAVVPVPVFVAAPAAPAPSRAGDSARDVTPQPGRIGPPPMPVRGQGNQGLSQAHDARSDAGSRTE
jgi:hypothetical protein